MHHPFFLTLFLLAVIIIPAQAASEFNAQVKAAYTDILKMKIENGRDLIQQELLRNPGNMAALLVENYTDFLPLVISQNPEQYKAALAAQENRLKKIGESREKSPYKLYAQAEIKIQMACAQFFFDDELRAGWNIRQAFLLLEQNQKLYPYFYPNRKALGLLQFAIGSIPDSYKWIVSLLGMKANIRTGLQNLKMAAQNNHPFQTEAAIQFRYLEDMLHRDAEGPVLYFEQLAKNNPDNLFFTFMAVSVLQKRKKCDAALGYFNRRPVGTAYFPLTFMHHMAADMYLFKGNYNRSLLENQYFLGHYRGKHYVKDAYYKMFLAAQLKPDAAGAKIYLAKIGTAGTDFVEEDQIALNYFSKPASLNQTLLKARLHADGGYYDNALEVIEQIDEAKLASQKDKIEYFYRSGRIYQGLEKPEKARELYQKTLALNGDLPYYFAPNAALQLGFMAQEVQDKKLAKQYFQKVLAYPKHDYKRSLDSKAKVALGNL